MTLAAGAIMGLGYGAALALGLRPIGSLGVFFQRWRFGSPAFAVLEFFLTTEHALLIACVTGLVALLILSRFQFFGPAGALAAPLLTSPMIFPWYLTPLVPAIALAPSATLLGWTLTAPLTYEAIDALDAQGRWTPAAWALWVIALGWVIGLVFDTARWRRRSP